MSNGFTIALACGPLKRQRYINSKIEIELRDFKKEIEDKYAKSKLTSFKMPKLVTAGRDSHDFSELSTKYNV
jgi:hypothetical protein